MESFKVRPAIVVSEAGTLYEDLFIIPLTSRTTFLGPGEFILEDWEHAGLNVASVLKRGIVLLHQSVIIKRIGTLGSMDMEKVRKSIRFWLGLSE
jgi:mRNA interferase MazF